ncbi:MAG TPA: dihydroorotate dehydrogenase [Deltaproteobacteria bacterium]|nr:dihydroorotate dehydrogenase [Deltaproteobacteria bacterium]HOM29070.1 dihydroorotate dehydrogenase [Deltaproteobacteria bacterium]HPP80264.1 dihydroorotate dehydrogenase [Deltaproteobacteria bacterium]
MELTTRLADGLIIANPVMNASGTFAYGEEFSGFFDLSVLGAVVTKGLSMQPKRGNPLPRIVETPCGMINSIGLENVGIHAFTREKLPFLRGYGVPVIVNFFGSNEEEYVQAARALDIEGVAALEMNVSCPNVKRGGIEFGKDPEGLNLLVTRVRQACSKPLIVKLSPMVTDICANAQAAVEAGADALTCINTIPAMAIDEETMRPVLGNVTGGLSGPAIKPVALKIVWEVSRRVSVPVIAAGGIASASDAVQFMLAGASAVQVGSASLRDPFCFPVVIEGIRAYLERKGITAVKDLVGSIREG